MAKVIPLPFCDPPPPPGLPVDWHTRPDAAQIFRAWSQEVDEWHEAIRLAHRVARRRDLARLARPARA